MRHKLLVVAAIILPLLLNAAETVPATGQETSISSSGLVEITLEAETAVLAGPIKITPDGMAFGNQCIHGYHVNRRGWATFEIMIPKEDDYVIWGRVNGRDGFTNSFFVRMNGGEEMIWETNKNNRYEWRRISSRGTGNITNPEIDPVVFRLKAGKHTLVIGNREKETRLDRLIITNDLMKMYDGAPTSAIKLDAPQTADVITPGSTVEIKWTARNISSKVNIDLSFDFGANFNIPVVHNTENDGSYMWTVPSWYNRPKVMMRISDAQGGPFDQNRGFFSLVQPNRVSLTLLNPIGGETVTATTTYVIRWREYAFNGITQILFSPDNGANWEVIADNQNAGGENHWNVPNIVSDKCLIKIQDKDGHPWDMSKSTFKIVAPPDLPGKGAHQATEPAAMPNEFSLLPNFPNPFNPQTTITFGVPEAGEVTLAVYDMQGRQVAVPVQGYRDAGRHQVTWNAVEFPSGTYIVVLQAGQTRVMQRMTLVK